MALSEDDTTTNRRNVLVVCLDTVRADFFFDYAKRLQELADVSFTQCRAVSSWTVPSHASMFTGELPSRHGVHTHNRRFDSIDREETFLFDLDGYTTFGVSANAFVSPDYGFDSWFDEFSVVEPQHRYPEATSLQEVSRNSNTNDVDKYVEYLRAALTNDYPLRSLSNTFLGFLHDTTKTGPLPKLVDDGASAVSRTAKRHVDDSDRPYFGFLNFMDAHTPLQPCRTFGSSIEGVPNSWTSTQYDVWELMEEPEKYDDYWRIRKLVYRAAIEYLDRVVADLVTDVLERSDRETTVVVTADHGENHCEEADDYLTNHKSSLSEGLLHVPLLLINPPDGYDNEETDPLSHLAFGDLITGMADGRTPDTGRTRLPAELVGMSAGPEPPSDYEFWNRMIRCVYDGTTKTVWDSLGTRTRYELDPDRPSWQRKVETGEGTPAVESVFFEDTIEDAKEAARNATPSTDAGAVDSATEARLEELGYL